MAKEESALVPESPKMAGLLDQLRDVSTPEAQRDVMVKAILAGRNNEISVTEGKFISTEFIKINSEAQARLKTARQTAD